MSQPIAQIKADRLRRVNMALVNEQARLAELIAVRSSDEPLLRAYLQIGDAIDNLCNYLNPDS
jgi:hypothetical protein